MRRHPLLLLLLGWLVLLATTAPLVAATPGHEPHPTPLPPDATAEEAQSLEDVESAYRAAYLDLATGDPEADHTSYAWPFDTPFTMGHAIQSYQYYSGSPAYFHHGMDIMAPDGTDVFNRSGGQVVNVENYRAPSDLYWEIAVKDPEGYIWQYHHIDKNTIPQFIKDKFSEYQTDPVNGGFIAPNTYIGDVVYWTVVSFGRRFNHIHLNILGAGGAYLNGFEFHTQLADTVGPELQAIGLLKNNTVQPGNTILGEYGLYVRARDLVLDDVYWLPPYRVDFSVDGGPVTSVWEFKDLPGGANKEVYVEDYYVVPPTCGNYDCRDFYIDLGFTTAGQLAFPPAQGQHAVDVTVYDYAGNQATGSFTWTVQAPPAGEVVFLDDFEAAEPSYTWIRNPSGADTATTGLWEVGDPVGTAYNGAKQLENAFAGSNDLVTDRRGGTTTSVATSYDIDGGITSVRSPDIVLPDSAALVLSFFSYLSHTPASTADFLRVTVVESAPPAAAGLSPDAPAATVLFEEQGANSDRDATWTYHEADLGAYRGKTVYLLVEAADGNPATTVVEAALDNVQITLTQPLDVALDSFASEARRNEVLIRWETASEVDNASFNLYRGSSPAGERTLLAIVPSQAPGSAESRSYSYTDTGVTAGLTYWYWLEDVDLGGARRMHGPVNATLDVPNAVTTVSARARAVVPSNAALVIATAALLATGWGLLRRRSRP